MAGLTACTPKTLRMPAMQASSSEYPVTKIRLSCSLAAAPKGAAATLTLQQQQALKIRPVLALQVDFRVLDQEQLVHLCSYLLVNCFKLL